MQRDPKPEGSRKPSANCATLKRSPAAISTDLQGFLMTGDDAWSQPEERDPHADEEAPRELTDAEETRRAMVRARQRARRQTI